MLNPMLQQLQSRNPFELIQQFNEFKRSMSISQSYALGMVYNNPLHRNALDQIGLAGAINCMFRKYRGLYRKYRHSDTSYHSWYL